MKINLQFALKEGGCVQIGYDILTTKILFKWKTTYCILPY